ncbi:MAG TPA: flagellar biosynthesis anti-sigma factor FlgM [Acidobacteriaceae bacterium]|jgi:hypothetical protein|nr:flagellar biosynthesis anti-sigma factor FlgM [Acidobacteriaceae bacterium]
MAGSCGLAGERKPVVSGRSCGYGEVGLRTPEVRFELVLELRRALAAGRYWVSAATLADAMLRGQKELGRVADSSVFVVQ